MVEFLMVATDTVRRTYDTNKALAISISVGMFVLLLLYSVGMAWGERDAEATGSQSTQEQVQDVGGSLP